MSAPAGLGDPRPTIVREGSDHYLAGGICRGGHPLPHRFPRCPRCGSEVEARRFGPEGSVWSFTTVHVEGGGDGPPPYTLAYVDLDAGPRVLLRISGEPGVGARVRLSQSSPGGNPTAGVLA